MNPPKINMLAGGYIYFYYSANQKYPIRVTDHFGRSLQFSYNGAGDQLLQVETPSGNKYYYAHDNFQLVTVAKPGGGVKTFYWNEQQYGRGDYIKGRLTGIVDENGSRFATYKYDKSSGRVLSTEHAGGANKYQFAYADNSPTVVTLPAGAKRSFESKTILGRVLTSGSTTSCTDGSCGQTEYSTYDVQGNLASTIDASGNKSCLAHDLRNQLVRSVSGLPGDSECSTALASPPIGSRTITVQWHPDIRKPVAIAEPLKLTLIAYDTSFRVSELVEKETSDSNGSTGMSAQVQGAERVLRYAYNEAGQVVSIQGPRSDAIEKFDYDSSGNLTTYTNALSHVTAYSQHDGDGRPGVLTLPSGSVITLNYSPSGQLLSMNQDSEITQYSYNAIGLMATAVTPDGEMLTFGYDPAHRLTTVQDGRGNKVALTLNTSGQATATVLTGANSAVVLRATRIFDALGRLKSVTGAAGL